MKKTVYLDHSATTPVRAEVLRAMQPFFSEKFGNASSVHSFGQEAKKYLEESRTKFSGLINAGSAEEIIFTGSGTESDNLAIMGVAYANKEKGNHIITTAIEHHAVLNACEFLEKTGFEVTYVPVDSNGWVDPDEVRKAITSSTILVSVMHTSNEVGTIQSVGEIGRMLKRENKIRQQKDLPIVYFHTDAVQSAGKVDIDVQKLGVDLLSISAHKFYGPKGVGALYRKKGVRMQPILHGGHHEGNLRAGTENVAGIVGMVRALEISCSQMVDTQKMILALKEKLEKGIVEKISNVKINAGKIERIAGISSISFSFVEGESLIVSLDLNGIACSTGSACASGSTEASHVLKAMCVDPVVAQGTVRFSLGEENTEQDIDHVLEVLPETVAKLRDISPLWQESKK